MPDGAEPRGVFFFLAQFYFPASGQAVVTGVFPSSPPLLAFNYDRAYRAQQSHSTLEFPLRVLLTHALALFAGQFVHKKEVPTEFIQV